MENIEYACKILGINPRAIERDADGKKRNEEEIITFLKERKNHRIHVLENKMQLSSISDELNEEIKQIKSAYNELINNLQVDTISELTTKCDKFEILYNKINGIPENAYSILGIARDICEERENEGTAIELDEAIKKRMEGLLKLADNTEMMNFKEKQKNELRKKQIQDAYESIKNSEKRKEYNKKLDVQKKKREESFLRNKYQAKTYERFNGQIGYKECENISEHKYYNQNDEQIKLTQTAIIAYKDFQVVNKLDEYEFARAINGKECKDKIYINLSIFDLSLDKNSKKPAVNPEYYNYVINELLSEENIEIAEKYNYGYMGKIIQNSEGKYQRVLDVREATIIKELSKRRNKNKDIEQNVEKGDR